MGSNPTGRLPCCYQVTLPLENNGQQPHFLLNNCHTLKIRRDTSVMEISVREFIKNYESGKYNDNNKKTMINAGWFDWTCKETSLKNKLDKLFPKIKQIANSPKIDIEKTCVLLLNRLKVGLSLDLIRFCEISTGDLVYSVLFSFSKRKNKRQSELWGRENNFDKPLIKGTWRDIRAFFK